MNGDTVAVEERGHGRLYLPDERDEQYPIRPMLSGAPPSGYRYWWPSGWWGDQGSRPWCVAYAWLHKVADGPRTTARTPGVDTTPAMDPSRLYCSSQEVDPWEGDCTNPRYDGTSVRAGAKVLQAAGMIDEYRWTWDATTVVRAILEVGPVVVGTSWWSGMTWPDEDGVLHPEGVRQGGHAYVLNGVNVDRGLVRCKNSWGRGWGRRGHAWLSVDDLGDLLADRGEACLPVLAEG